jgi:hypothetical protein
VALYNMGADSPNLPGAMLRSLSVISGLSLLVLGAFAHPAHAQFPDLFAPFRPPANVPDDGEERVPDLPRQGRVLPTPNRQPQRQPQDPNQPLPPPPGQQGAIRSQPLPPPPGMPQNPPGTPPGSQQGSQQGSVGGNPPGLAPGQRQPNAKGAPPAPSQAALQPGDEVVSEPPKQKITNKQAVFSGLDKITGRIINFDADIGETVQFGALRVKTDACYTRPATEAANTDAFVSVEEITLQGEVKKIFSGWMFAGSPGLHAVEHPIYDVWLTDCKGPEQVAIVEPPKPAPVPQQKRAPQPKQAPQAQQQQNPQMQQQQRPPQPPPQQQSNPFFRF